MNPTHYIGEWFGQRLHEFGVNLSADLDAFLAIALCLLLFLRLFQWKAMGKAILPVVGVYCVLKVLLP
jgi:Ca2+/Na+ antiporter